MTDDFWLPDLVSQADAILDAGCGPHGSDWWRHKKPESVMVAVDLFNQPPQLPPNTRFFSADIAQFCETGEYDHFFDLVVADHILEHVANPSRVCQAFNLVARLEARVHVGVPDATNFTDRFYHLIHPEGGGHISLLTLDSVTAMMTASGFERTDYRPWPDDWGWFQRLYDWRGRGIQYITQADIDYIADVFRRELTPEKGYYYGWEIVFVKREDLPISDRASSQVVVPPATTTDPVTVQTPASDAPANPFTPLEIAELRWLAYWAHRLKQSRFNRMMKAIGRKLI